MKHLIRKYIRESMLSKNNFQSHTFEPMPGDSVINTNKNCKHFQSQGIVLDIKDLIDDAGKVVVYQVINSGNSFSEGDVLEKTMDQLSPYNELEEIKDFINSVLSESNFKGAKNF